MQTMQSEPNPGISGFMVFMNLMNSITQMVLGAVAMCALVFAINFPSNFSGHLVQHVILCVIGYVIMMAQAVLSFSPHSGWTMSLRYEDKRVIHWIMQIIGAILAITGSIIRIINVNEVFQNAHGIIGLIAMIFTFLSLLGGVFNLCFKSTIFTKIVHSCTGSLTLLFAFLALCLGFDKSVCRLFLGDTVSDLAIALTVAGLVGVLMSASVTSIKRLCNR